ncbi:MULTISPECIES: hypothetical protein [Sinorhizobium]|uniref:hypothetical protein n=1 Tax=Sinorhizobium TaxID=28105 RepID=UPI000C9AC8EA|nr:hypothetical protein [Sinorhizobium sp. M4_45]PND23895.1 hypothetical protein CN933_30505 [Sinorhizobium sp. M4_45]
MRDLATALAAVMLAAQSAAAEEPLVFHTAQFEDATVVSLGLVSNTTTERPGYDYDVVISLSQTNSRSGVVYNDPGKHRALVKCGDPARVSVRGVDYSIPTSGAVQQDWKADLWRAVCESPVS